MPAVNFTFNRLIRAFNAPSLTCAWTTLVDMRNNSPLSPFMVYSFSQAEVNLLVGWEFHEDCFDGVGVLLGHGLELNSLSEVLPHSGQSILLLPNCLVPRAYRFVLQILETWATVVIDLFCAAAATVLVLRVSSFSFGLCVRDLSALSFMIFLQIVRSCVVLLAIRVIRAMAPDDDSLFCVLPSRYGIDASIGN